MSKLLVVFVLACWPLAAPAADVSELIKKLGSKDNETRRAAANELGELGKEAAPAVKALTAALKDSDSFVRRFSAQALGKIGPDASSAVDALGVLLNDDKQPVRKAAVQALGNMGTSGVPALSKALRGASSDVQELAIPALGKSGTEGLPALIGVIKDTKIDASLRRMAVEAVVPMGKKAHSAVPTLAEVVKTPRAIGREAGQFRLDAVSALGALATKEDSSAITALENIVNDAKERNNNLKNQCRQALKKINARG